MHDRVIRTAPVVVPFCFFVNTGEVGEVNKLALSSTHKKIRMRNLMSLLISDYSTPNP